MSLAALLPAPALAQTGSPSARKATTVAALVNYPVFFHTQTVRVRGELAGSPRMARLTSGEAEVFLAGPAVADSGDLPKGEQEVVGAFFDVGRLQQGDPRLSRIDMGELWQSRTGRSWPGVGELTVLVVDRLAPAEPFVAPSIRALALAPTRYAGERVTLTGRFRGLNLFGDLPDQPSRERQAFVLQSAEGAVWVVGMRPKGDGFNLNPAARVDTGRWLEVSGNVFPVRGLAVILAENLRLAKPPADTPEPTEAAAVVPAVGPAPEVVFSTPTQGETDVAPATRVRIQFSRDVDPATIKGQVRVGYRIDDARERGEPEAPPMTFTTTYNEGTRVLELRFGEPLARFREVRVELGDGIRTFDGAALVRWALSFTVGG